MMLKAFVDGLAGQSAIGIRPDVARMSTDGIRMILEGLAGKRAGEDILTDGTGTDG